MNDNDTHPFVLEIVGAEGQSSSFGWCIRRYGTLIERSDRWCRTEEEARKSGSKAIERLFAAENRGR